VSSAELPVPGRWRVQPAELSVVGRLAGAGSRDGLSSARASAVGTNSICPWRARGADRPVGRMALIFVGEGSPVQGPRGRDLDLVPAGRQRCGRRKLKAPRGAVVEALQLGTDELEADCSEASWLWRDLKVARCFAYLELGWL
jgi:hypothetical protein